MLDGRDVDETFSFETETFERLFEMRPRRDLPIFSRDRDFIPAGWKIIPYLRF